MIESNPFSGILAVDISYTYYNKKHGFYSDQTHTHSALLVYWNIIYWGTVCADNSR